VRDDLLLLRVRTPAETVLEARVRSVRVPTETGQVGLRPRIERLVLAVEPGLVLARTEERIRFVGTAGGLLRCDGAEASLLTPLAVAGEREEEVLASLDAALSRPGAEMQARAMLDRLQRSILRELRQVRDGQVPEGRSPP
jgi:F0F1-type ATP synthase epsilon subunit